MRMGDLAKHQKTTGNINVWSAPKSEAKYLIKPDENWSFLDTFPKRDLKRHKKQLAFPCSRDVPGRLGKTSENNWKYQRSERPVKWSKIPYKTWRKRILFGHFPEKRQKKTSKTTSISMLAWCGWAAWQNIRKLLEISTFWSALESDGAYLVHMCTWTIVGHDLL